MNHSSAHQSQTVLCGEPEVFSICYPDNKIEAAVPRNSLVAEDLERALKPEECKRRYWWIATCSILGVFAVVLLLVTCPNIFNSPAGNSSTLLKQTMLLDDILDEKYSPRWFNGTWESDTEFSYQTKSGELWLHDMETMTSTNLLVNKTLIPGPVFTYSMSPDHKYLTVGYNISKRFRHVFSRRYSVIDLEAQTSKPILNSFGEAEKDVLQLIIWAPLTNAYAYVYRNNIYYRPSAGNDTEYEITSSGIPGEVYNGVSDWIYDDAVFGSSMAMTFSTNGSRLAFATFNDSLVMEQPITLFGEPGRNGTQYPKVVNIKYPKVGTPNPTVSVSVVDLTNPSMANLTVMNIPLPENLSEPILSGITWANDEEVLLVWKNRVQSQLRMIICNCTDTLVCQEVWRQEETDSWAGVFGAPRFSLDGSRMMFISPQEQKDGVGKFRHVTLIERDQPEARVVALTAGTYSVIDIVAWDENSNDVFFTATVEGDPASVHLFAVYTNTSDAPYTADCITCGWTSVGGDVECQYSTAYFSMQNSFYMYHCWGPDVPEIAFYNRDHKLLTMWEDNHSLRESLVDKALPRVLRLQVPVPGGHMAQVKLWLPPDLDLHTKYPLLVDVYAGPDSHQITNRFEVDWRYYLTTNKSMVYAVIDGRGSGLKGDKMRFAGYKRLGTVEIQDQISVTKYLLKKYPYLDAERTAIWGWSYGGYSTLMTLANDTEDVFKCGIAVAPVTDWTYYTSMYTERKMGLPTPEDNLIGYELANINDKAENFRNKKLFLIHGTFDNIALYQNSMMFARVLQKKRILFRQQIYPDEDHALAGVTHHLHLSMIEFLEECFNSR